jgi:hypothetical protein
MCLAYEEYLPKGSLVKVYAKIPLTTAELQEGSEVFFVAPADVWVCEKKAIEKGDIFRGYVDNLKMPILGVNAAMSVKITKIVDKYGDERDFKGKIIFFGSSILGGNLTYPASYNKVIHPRKVYGNSLGGTLQYVPSGEYQFGNHVGVTPRDSLFVELDERI